MVLAETINVFSIVLDATKTLSTDESETYNKIIKNYKSHDILAQNDNNIILKICYYISDDLVGSKIIIYKYLKNISNLNIEKKDELLDLSGFYIDDLNIAAELINFTNGVDIRHCFFACDIKIDSNVINNTVFLMQTIFTGEVIFQNIKFDVKNFIITNCSINGKKFSFVNTQFICKNIIKFYNNNFNECRLEFNIVEFNSSKLKIEYKTQTKENKLSLTFFDCTFNTNARIDVDNMYQLKIRHSLIEKDMQIYNGSEQLSIKGTVISGRLSLAENFNYIEAINKYYLADNFNYTEAINNYYEKIKEPQEKVLLRQKKHEFYILNQIYRNLGQYENEDISYFEYMKNSIEYQKIDMGKSRLYNSEYLFKKLAGKIGDYGTNPLKILGWSLAIIIFFTVLYSFVFLTTENYNILDAFYFSGITFLTIGYGDINPEKFTNMKYFLEVLTVIEGFLGITIVSFFMVAVVRKVLR